MDEQDLEPLYIPHLKARFWEETGLDHSRYQTFVETGSYRGFTLDFMKSRFRSIHSIELSDKWFRFCKDKFKHHPHMHFYHGNSTELLPKVLDAITEPAIVFLDAHYSGGSTVKADDKCDSPLLTELAYLRSRRAHDIIIVDDTGFFDAKGGEEPLSSVDNDVVWPAFAYDWSGITREKVLQLIKLGYGFFDNTDSRYTFTPREDQLIFYPKVCAGNVGTG
jgi:hypothetical protein